MMGDLIDRKVLLESLKASRLHHAETSKEMELLIRCENIVMGQPTAYNVDKVVEELQGLTIEFEFFGMCNDYVEISHAIETIRAGRKSNNAGNK